MINPALAPKLPKEQTDVPLKTVIWELTTAFLPLALLIVAVLGAILFGLATPSEAAGAGALASLVLAAAYGTLRFQMLKESVYLTARASAMVCFLFIGSWTFSAVFAVLGGQKVVEDFFLSLNLSPDAIPAAYPSPDLPAWLAAGMDRDHHHLRAYFPAAAG